MECMDGGLDGWTDRWKGGNMERWMEGRRSVGVELKRNRQLLTKRGEFPFNLMCTMPKKYFSWKGPQKSRSSNPSIAAPENAESPHNGEFAMKSRQEGEVLTEGPPRPQSKHHRHSEQEEHTPASLTCLVSRFTLCPSSPHQPP